MESNYTGQSILLGRVTGLHLTTQKEAGAGATQGVELAYSRPEGALGKAETADLSEESGRAQATSFDLLSAVLLAFLAQQRPGFWACLAF